MSGYRPSDQEPRVSGAMPLGTLLSMTNFGRGHWQIKIFRFECEGLLDWRPVVDTRSLNKQCSLTIQYLNVLNINIDNGNISTGMIDAARMNYENEKIRIFDFDKH